MGLTVAIAVAVILGLAPPAWAQVTVRINAGGPSYTDGLGQVWAADTRFSGGSTYATTEGITGTTDDPLYQTERFGNVTYQIPVTNGSYEVALHFAEIFWPSAGQRVFDVFVEGVLVADNLDILAQVGRLTPLVISVPASVTDGVLTVQFVTVVDNAKVSAIEVLTPDTPIPPTDTCPSDLADCQTALSEKTVELATAQEQLADTTTQLMDTQTELANVTGTLDDARALLCAPTPKTVAPTISATTIVGMPVAPILVTAPASGLIEHVMHDDGVGQWDWHIRRVSPGVWSVSFTPITTGTFRLTLRVTTPTQVYEQPFVVEVR